MLLLINNDAKVNINANIKDTKCGINLIPVNLNVANPESIEPNITDKDIRVITSFIIPPLFYNQTGLTFGFDR